MFSTRAVKRGGNVRGVTLGGGANIANTAYQRQVVHSVQAVFIGRALYFEGH